MIVRELTGGVYFGEPKEIIDLGNGQKRARRHPGLRHLRDRAHRPRSPSSWPASASARCTSAEKRNVMKTGVLWNEVVTEIHNERISRRRARPHAGRQLRHAAGAHAQAVRRHRHRQSVRRHAVRRRRDADRLARHAAVGLARRADAKTGKRKALYEPVHGSAPDIAGKGVANPIAMIAQLRHGAALFVRSRRSGGPDRQGDRRRARSGPAHRRHQQDGAAPSAPARWATPSSRRTSTAPGREEKAMRHASTALLAALVSLLTASGVAVAAGDTGTRLRGRARRRQSARADARGAGREGSAQGLQDQDLRHHRHPRSDRRRRGVRHRQDLARGGHRQDARRQDQLAVGQGGLPDEARVQAQAPLAMAMSEADYEIVMPAQKARCTLAQKRRASLMWSRSPWRRR